jgi:hypothetical protein
VIALGPGESLDPEAPSIVGIGSENPFAAVAMVASHCVRFVLARPCSAANLDRCKIVRRDYD